MHKPVIGQDSSDYARRQRWLRYRKPAIAALVAVVVLVLGLLLWQYMSNRSSQAKSVNAAIAASQDAYTKGDYSNALNLVGASVQKATSNAQKAQVYQMQAQASTGLGRLADAAHYYELKHQVDSSTIAPDAYALGTIYERLGEKNKALAQYHIALDYAKKRGGQYNSDAGAVQASINELEQSK